LIFASLGTHGQPFPRMLRLLEELPKTQAITAQVGKTAAADLPNLTCYRYLSFGEMQAFMREAEVVVCHAGVGSILTAIEAGHRPVVIPRLHEHDEHVDDHQLHLATELHDQGHVLCYRQGDSLSELIVAARMSEVQGNQSGGAELGRAIWAEVKAACYSGRWPRHRRAPRPFQRAAAQRN
jgi:UDP-N-acetylglucosamine transferase subunit ALG13